MIIELLFQQLLLQTTYLSNFHFLHGQLFVFPVSFSTFYSAPFIIMYIYYFDYLIHCNSYKIIIYIQSINIIHNLIAEKVLCDNISQFSQLVVLAYKQRVLKTYMLLKYVKFL